ncbi:unnamed protein product [Cunninghamella blakesleeana]
MQASFYCKLLLFVLSFQYIHTYQLVQYWGQNSASKSKNGLAAQKPLSYYCQDDTQDILIISFVHIFGLGDTFSYDISNAGDKCDGMLGSTLLLNCKNTMEKDIQYCQKRNKKIFLSLGGAAGAYGLSTPSDGKKWANIIWDTFGNGKSKTRPFGKAVVDGFDLDIEAGESKGYTSFVDTMRKLYQSDKSKQYYISGAPQCAFPDAWLGDALNNAWFDYVFIQFYNNYCGVQSDQFNYDTWDQWAKKTSKNKNVQLFVGIPGSPSAAGSGYIPYKKVVSIYQKLKSKKSFGGFMMWDVSQSYDNTEVKPNFAKAVAKAIGGGKGSASGGSSKVIDHHQPTPTLKPTPKLTKSSSGSDEECTCTEESTTHRHKKTIQSGKKSRTKSPSRSTPTQVPSSKKGVKQGASCSGTFACTSDGSGFGQCVHNKWVIQNCATGLKCKEASGSILCL